MAGESLPDTVPALPGCPAERLPGARKAAVLMAALGSERAANVMQRMDEEEIESLSHGDGPAELGRSGDDRLDLQRTGGRRRRWRQRASAAAWTSRAR